MSKLVLGPLLRYAGETDATVWVETDADCEVEILGCSSRTFCVVDHHYAIVHVEGLHPGQPREYEVRLDGEKVWPEPGSPFPPSVIRPIKSGETIKLVFGSCRISAPHEPPFTLDHDEDERGLGVDALYATAMELKDGTPEELPHALVFLGDQIYAHKPPFDTLRFIDERRDTAEPPGEVVANFEEYARIYRDALSDPAIRWLLSTVPSAMVFDDHEVGDDWNISEAWVEEMRQHPSWNDRIVGGYASYWVYQHLGNLPPRTCTEMISTQGTWTPKTPGPSCASSPTTPTASQRALAWRLIHEAAFFDNQIATLELAGRSATITFEKAVLDTSKEPALEKFYEYGLA